MLRSITIQNFKGVGQKIEVELRPVTLLFGPNSAGKSTILHAIHYAHAVLESGNPDVGRTRLGGEIDLGGFEKFVHGHDLDKEVVIGFHFEPDEDDIDDHLTSVLAAGGPIPGSYFDASEFQSFSLSLAINWSKTLHAPRVTGYEVSVNGHPVAELEANLDGAQTWITNINEAHPLLYGDDEDEVASFVEEQYPALLPNGMALPAANQWGFRIESADWEDWFSHRLQMLVSLPRPLLSRVLERFRYVGPIRQAPSHAYTAPKRWDESRWANGLGAWDTMRTNSALRKQVNEWMTKEQYLDTGYEIAWHSYRELDDATLNYIKRMAANDQFGLEDVQADLETLPKKGRLVVIDRDKDLRLAPSALGEGIAQVVPVVAAALSGSVALSNGTSGPVELVAIEQPELHIHPRMQVVLGDLFLSQCSERQFLIETHSEHLMLRLLRRIRETTDNELPPDAPEATTEMISVLYVVPGTDGIRIKPLRVSDDGEFDSRWPDGFFDERLKELL